MASREMGPRLGALRARIARMPPGTRARILFGGLAVLTAVFLLYETRGTTLWFDDWNYALYRRGASLATFLKPQNQHFSLVPIAIYKFLFATAGLDHYGPYRLIVIAGHLACSVLLFVYASRRLGSYLALLVASLFLLFGPAWQTSIWPIQIAWIIPVGAGVAGLLMLDRHDRLGDLVSCGLIGLALASSGIGLPIALGLTIEVLGSPDRRRRAWIAVIPFALLAVWWLAYQTSDFHRHNIVLMPPFVFRASAGALAALLGLEGDAVFESATTPLIWGAPLLFMGIVALIVRLWRLGMLPLRLASLLTMALSFWTLTGLTRATLVLGYESRYLYISGMLILLIAVELARGVRLNDVTKAVVGVVFAAAIVSNIGAFREGARFLRDQGRQTKGGLAALEMTRSIVAPGYVAHSVPGYPLVLVRAGAYFSAEKAYGTPADTPAQLAKEPELVRVSADDDLIRIHNVGLAAAPAGPSLGRAPALGPVTGGSVVDRGSCAQFRPAAFGSPSTTAAVDFILPATGVLLRTGNASATVSVRRFADEYPSTPAARLSASSSAVLRIAPDSSRAPWHVRVAPAERVTICGLS